MTTRTTWANITRKTGPGGVGAVSEEYKDSIITDAVTTWQQMGLTQQQIAYGIAAIGVESGFNPDAVSSTGPIGLGQFSQDTWTDAVKYYNDNYSGHIDVQANRNDPAAQIAVMGAWSSRIWEKASTWEALGSG